MSTVLYLNPPEEIYSSAVVERGLIGFASHILNPKSPELSLLRDVWEGNTLHSMSAAFMLRDKGPRKFGFGDKYTHRSTHQGKSDVTTIYDVLLPNSIIYPSTENLLGVNRFCLGLPHYPKGLFWTATLGFTKKRAHVLLTQYRDSGPVSPLYRPFQQKRSSVLIDGKGKSVERIIIPFTYSSDDLDLWLLFEYATYLPAGMLPLVEKAREQGISEIKRLKNVLAKLIKHISRDPFDERVTGMPYTLTGKKLEQQIERTQLRLDVTKRALSRDIPLLARVQAEINHLTLKRAWKAAMLGMLQVAELKYVGDHDHDQN